MSPHAGEVLATVGGFVLLGGYLAFYVAEVFASNSSNPRWRARAHGTVFNWAVRARRVWARSVTAKESDTVVGVQTIRNVLMVSTFLGATVCILIQLQVTWLISSETLEMIADIAALDPLVDPSGPELVPSPVKAAFVLVDLTAALLCFTMASRYLMHCGFFIRAAAVEENPEREAMRDVLAVSAGKEEGCIARRADGRTPIQAHGEARARAAGVRAEDRVPVRAAHVPLTAWLFGPTYLLLFAAAMVGSSVALDMTGVPAARKGYAAVAAPSAASGGVELV